MDPVPGWNLAYTIHFWASTHKQVLRDTVSRAKSSGVAIFATEWGTCSAGGDGTLDLPETDVWLKFLAFHGISYANWAISDKQEACSALVPGASAGGGWSDGELTASGRYVREAISNGHDPVEPGPSLGCCRFGEDCGDCGKEGTGWCHESASNCATCTGSFDPSGPAPWCGGGGGCCRFGADCGDCGEDGTGWCHESASNCATCTGSFDPSAPTPCCGSGCPVPTPAPPPPTPTTAPSPPPPTP